MLPDEQGVVLRFGKFVSTTQPGLNYHIPYPIETVLTPKVTKVNRIMSGLDLQVTQEELPESAMFQKKA